MVYNNIIKGVDKFMNLNLKEEWINGVHLMSPRPQLNHMEIEQAMFKEFDKYFHGRCRVAIETSLFLTKDNPKDIKSDLSKLKELISGKKSEIVPDIAVYCDDNQRFRRGYIGIPQIIVEVLSPSNSDDDTLIKKDTYESYGVPEYWILSPMNKTATIYELENNRYVRKSRINFLEDIMKSNKFNDLVVDIRNIELFDEDTEI